jgi:hypothetical protein
MREVAGFGRRHGCVASRWCGSGWLAVSASGAALALLSLGWEVVFRDAGYKLAYHGIGLASLPPAFADHGLRIVAIHEVAPFVSPQEMPFRPHGQQNGGEQYRQQHQKSKEHRCPCPLRIRTMRRLSHLHPNN